MGPTPAVAAVRAAVRTALETVPFGSLVLVACSGGTDSLALAAATGFVAPRMDLVPAGITIDHNLGRGSAQVASNIAFRLRDLNLDPVKIVRVDVGTTGGPEAAARTARYQAFEDVADQLSAAAVLLGHTRDDQAESVLLGLARGSGARSLSGMAPVNGHYLRPLLGVPRALLRQSLEDLGLDPWEDPANRDSTFTRVRVRHTVLPTMEQQLGPGIAAALARTAELLRADADALDGWAGEARTSASDGDGNLLASTLAVLPHAVRSRALRSAAIDAGCPPNDLSAVHISALDALVTAWRGQGPLDLPGRVRASRSADLIRFAGPG